MMKAAQPHQVPLGAAHPASSPKGLEERKRREEGRVLASPWGHGALTQMQSLQLRQGS